MSVGDSGTDAVVAEAEPVTLEFTGPLLSAVPVEQLLPPILIW